MTYTAFELLERDADAREQRSQDAERIGQLEDTKQHLERSRNALHRIRNIERRLLDAKVKNATHSAWVAREKGERTRLSLQEALSGSQDQAAQLLKDLNNTEVRSGCPVLCCPAYFAAICTFKPSTSKP